MSNCVPSHIYWACRRGMLELDLWLGKFLNNIWPSLSLEQKEIFEVMLLESDVDIYQWITRQSVPDNLAVKSIIQLIQSANAIN